MGLQEPIRKWIDEAVAAYAATQFGTHTVDAVDELTPGAGVTVDGVLIKDGQVDGVDLSVHAADGDAHHAEAHAHAHSAITGVGADDHHAEWPAYLCYLNNSAQNLNGTNVKVNWSIPQVTIKGTDITFNALTPSRVIFATAGVYEVSVNVYGESTTARANISIALWKNGSAYWTTLGAGGYIRNYAGHNEASAHLAPQLLSVSGSDYVEVVANGIAAAGSWNTTARTSSITVQRVG